MNFFSTRANKKTKTCTMSSYRPQAGPPTKKLKFDGTIDIPANLGYESGTRLQVKWNISDEDDDADKGNDDKVSEEGSNKAVQVWWTATLKPRTDQTHTLTPEEQEEVDVDAHDVTLPVYELDYDPLPDLEFYDRSIEQVAFVSNTTLLNLSSDEIMIYRRFGEASPPASPAESDSEEDAVRAGDRHVTPAGLNSLMETILQSSIKNSGINFSALPMNRQQMFAERVKTMKDRLHEKLLVEMEKIEEKGGPKVITGDIVRRCLSELDGGVITSS